MYSKTYINWHRSRCWEAATQFRPRSKSWSWCQYYRGSGGSCCSTDGAQDGGNVVDFRLSSWVRLDEGVVTDRKNRDEAWVCQWGWVVSGIYDVLDSDVSIGRSG